MAYDLPTQLGIDSDDETAQDDVGRLGVAVDTVEDMAGIFEGIPLDKVSVSHTINSTAAIIQAFWLIAAERQGVALDKLRGTFQNDMLKNTSAGARGYSPQDPPCAWWPTSSSTTRSTARA